MKAHLIKQVAAYDGPRVGRRLLQGGDRADDMGRCGLGNEPCQQANTDRRRSGIVCPFPSPTWIGAFFVRRREPPGGCRRAVYISAQQRERRASYSIHSANQASRVAPSLGTVCVVEILGAAAGSLGKASVGRRVSSV